MTQEELNAILENHKKWLEGNGGERANLKGANLRGANLCGANLCDANLRDADMTKEQPFMPCNARKKGHISDTKRREEKS